MDRKNGKKQPQLQNLFIQPLIHIFTVGTVANYRLRDIAFGVRVRFVDRFYRPVYHKRTYGGIRFADNQQKRPPVLKAELDNPHFNFSRVRRTYVPTQR